MDYALEKLSRVIIGSPRVIDAAVVAIEALIVVALLSVPEFLDAAISAATLFCCWYGIRCRRPARRYRPATSRCA